MVIHAEIQGIIGYLVTPFSDDGRINVHVLETMINRLIDHGVHAIAPLGSTGELAYLSNDEFRLVVDHCLSTVDQRIPVIVGVSGLTTANTIWRAQYAHEAGAQAIMVAPVTYWKLSEREIYQHYRSISEHVPIPIIAYNNPATAGIDMSPEFLVSMFETIDMVTMVKESTGDLNRMIQIAQLSGGQLPFYNGSNPLVLEALRVGASGWCTAAPNLCPQQCQALYCAVMSNDFVTAQRIYDQLKPLLEFIVAGGLPATIKAGLNLLGIPAGSPRRPLLDLPAHEQDYLAKLLHQ